MKRNLYFPVFTAILLIAILACSTGQPSPTPEVAPIVVIGSTPTVTTPPAPASATPEICPPGWTVVEGECARPFLQPIPEDFGLNAITSPTTHLYPIGVSGTVYSVSIEHASAGVMMPEGIDYVINLGSKDGQSQFGMITMAGETEFRYDRAGVAVSGDYHPVQSLDRWYRENVNNPLVEEIKTLVNLINEKSLCALPQSDPSPAYRCRPIPTTPTP